MTEQQQKYFDIETINYKLYINSVLIMAYLKARQNTPHTEQQKHNIINNKLNILYNKKYKLLQLLQVEQISERVKNNYKKLQEFYNIGE